ncbi:hypothetical protein D9757_007611 [Collybiopsis confluens]|uniref:Uncharacterized protein n=1 Tax=Collybiopsis confluens TaxID=2823264 RepID=A0A8H5H9T5_9AGAR|nr:hypothetical protein D9757_007611 [Collybiopsis confluens]
MNTPLPNSPKTSKATTYSRKQKRKRDHSEDVENRSAHESESETERVAKPANKSPNTSKKQLTNMSVSLNGFSSLTSNTLKFIRQPPESTVPTASRSTGSSKRSRVDSGAPDNTSVKSKKGHVRVSPSIASLKNVQLSTTSTPPSSKKPASVRGHKLVSSISKRQVAPSESDFDDGASVTDSIVPTNRVRRTEEERIEYFKNQPECSSLEPNRVKCTRCQKYVALGNKTSYNVRPWEKHRARCDLKPAVEHQASPEAVDEEVPVTPRMRTTEEERKGILLADPNVQEVEADRVLCKKCSKWIRLSTSRAYLLANWKQHIKACGAPVPGSRVATAARKLQLVNDEQVKSFSVNSVICNSCNTTVELTKDVDYNLTLWDEHKTACEGPKSGSVPFPTKSPSSVGSSSTVVVQGQPAPRGVKRSLEETEAELSKDDPDARPQIRLRTEDYVAPTEEPPSVLGWFMIPFKSFVRGFRESMGKGASAPVLNTPPNTSTA